MLCQAFSDVLLDAEDVDEEDASDPSLCSSYVKDIYKYLRQLEVSRSRSEVQGASANTDSEPVIGMACSWYSLSPMDFPEALISHPLTLKYKIKLS